MFLSASCLFDLLIIMVFPLNLGKRMSILWPIDQLCENLSVVLPNHQTLSVSSKIRVFCDFDVFRYVWSLSSCFATVSGDLSVV